MLTALTRGGKGGQRARPSGPKGWERGQKGAAIALGCRAEGGFAARAAWPPGAAVEQLIATSGAGRRRWRGRPPRPSRAAEERVRNLFAAPCPARQSHTDPTITPPLLLSTSKTGTEAKPKAVAASA